MPPAGKTEPVDLAQLVADLPADLWCRHHGRYLVGYVGAAQLLNVTPQWLRKLATARSGQPDDLPGPVDAPKTATAQVWFDLATLVRWAIQTGKLNPDGTPTRTT